MNKIIKILISFLIMVQLMQANSFCMCNCISDTTTPFLDDKYFKKVMCYANTSVSCGMRNIDLLNLINNEKYQIVYKKVLRVSKHIGEIPISIDLTETNKGTFSIISKYTPTDIFNFPDSGDCSAGPGEYASRICQYFPKILLDKNVLMAQQVFHQIDSVLSAGQISEWGDGGVLEYRNLDPTNDSYHMYKLPNELKIKSIRMIDSMLCFLTYNLMNEKSIKTPLFLKRWINFYTQEENMKKKK